MRIPIVTFVGRSGAGKTTLLVKLIAELRRRGYRVATIKHHSHNGFDIDRPGKDSWRHARAGSEHVIVAAPDKMATYRVLDRELSLSELAASISGVDLILVEGYKQADLPTFEVVRAANSLELVARPEHRFAVATDTPLDLPVPQYGLEDVEGIADCIEGRFLQREPCVRQDSADSGISYAQALAATLRAIQPLGIEAVDLAQACGRVVAQDLVALVDSPSVDASLKDGYAIRSADVAGASPESPVRLRLAGVSAAGHPCADSVRPGTAVRVLTGAPIPQAAEAVVSAEFATDDGQVVTLVNDAERGRNILARGSDVARGEVMVAAGTVLRPVTVGLLAAAGHARVPVYRRPRVAILATGDEVVAPGTPLAPGKLYASNVATLAAWCSSAGLAVTTRILPDAREAILAGLRECVAEHDAILTSGGAWNSDRDLVVRLLDELGWEKHYHRVRMGPGKAAAFGLWQGKPVFCLPGGPPSNHMAFLQLALPGLGRLEGRTRPGLPVQVAHLARAVRGQREWTQFIHGRLERGAEGLSVHPMHLKSRLQEMAGTEAIIRVPEGVDHIPEGTLMEVQLLGPLDLRAGGR